MKKAGIGCGIGGFVLLLATILLAAIFLVTIIGAATAAVRNIPIVGGIIGWVWGGGAPDGQPSRYAPDGGPPELWTPTPIPMSCSITPTPVIVQNTPDPNAPTPVPPNTAIPPGSVALPTPTPCPTPVNRFLTPNARWTPLPNGSGPQGHPLRGGIITQGFGCTDYTLEPEDKYCPTLHTHWGLDISDTGYNGCGTTVFSTLTGTVVYASSGFVQWERGNPYPYQGYGNVVGIVQTDNAGNQWRTAYAHLCQPYVFVGQQVQAGQPIGLEGSTGMSGGTHVHYEVWLNGVLRDPLGYW